MNKVKDNNDKLVENKRDFYLKKMSADEEKLQRVRAQQEEKLIAKQRNDFIKQNEKKENIERMQKMQEYQKSQVLEKIQTNSQRIENIKKEKEKLYESRRIMQQEITLNKQKMLEQFEKMKQGKIDPKKLSDEMQIKAKSQEAIPDNQTEKNPVKKESIKNNSVNLPKPKAFISKEAAEKQLEDLKLKLNDEMKTILDEEEKNEQQRDEELDKVTDEAERIEMEKAHGFERAKAQKRITDLAAYFI